MSVRKRISLMKNNRGWLEIVEAFVAILLVAGVLLFILNRNKSQDTEISNQVYNIEVSIIREIQTTSELRESVLSVPEVPTEWEEFPSTLREKIISRTPAYLTCVGKICELNTACNLGGVSAEESKGKNVYSETGIISPTVGSGEIYRQLNLFCWVK